MTNRPDPAIQAAIQQLYDRYAYAVDELDTDVLADCYVGDATFRCSISSAGSQSGRDAIVERQVDRHRQEDFREKHVITGVVVRQAEGDTVRSYASGVIYATRDGETSFEASGHYEDEALHCDDGHWRFTTRAFIADTVAGPITTAKAG
jgi:3-phenylpropionate/cinnamic acid dioxygenase small subunit